MNITATLLVQIIVFLILGWFTMRFVWPPIVTALDERARKVAEGIAAAERAKAELSNASNQSAQTLIQARENATGIIGSAEKRAQHLAEEAKAKANAEAVAIIAAARADAQAQLAAAKEQLRSRVAALAVAGAEQILRREVNAKVHEDLLSRLSAQL